MNKTKRLETRLFFTTRHTIIIIIIIIVIMSDPRPSYARPIIVTTFRIRVRTRCARCKLFKCRAATSRCTPSRHHVQKLSPSARRARVGAFQNIMDGPMWRYSISANIDRIDVGFFFQNRCSNRYKSKKKKKMIR